MYTQLAEYLLYDKRSRLIEAYWLYRDVINKMAAAEIKTGDCLSCPVVSLS
mgnify:CR=1 FL=1